MKEMPSCVDACLEELSEYKSDRIALAVGLLVCRAPRRRPRRWAGNETLAVADGHLLSAIRTQTHRQVPSGASLQPPEISALRLSQARPSLHPDTSIRQPGRLRY